MSGADRISSIALCWRIERRDGVTVALTDHDEDLTVGGLVYRAAPGMTPSAIVRAEGVEADTMEASGARGMQSFDMALYNLYKDERIDLEEALNNADSRSNLEQKVNFG
mgnify:CR=1 FL=1